MNALQAAQKQKIRITAKLTAVEALAAVAARIDQTSGCPTFTAQEHDALAEIVAQAERGSKQPACTNPICHPRGSIAVTGRVSMGKALRAALAARETGDTLRFTGDPADALYQTYGF